MSPSTQFRPLVVSAPSKVIMHGEHAVVYGMTAVAAALDLRTKMTIKPHNSHVVVNFPDLGLSDCWSIEKLRELFRHKPTTKVCEEVDLVYLDRIHDMLGVDQSNLRMASVICFLYLYSVIIGATDIVPMEIQVESEIPLGAGLGSSAALSVCLAAGLIGVVHQVRGTEKSILAQVNPSLRKEVCQLAFLSEKILHGTPSGIDNSVSTYGGLVKFSGGELTPLPPLKEGLNILLVNTGVGRSTKELVDRVRVKYQNHPSIVKPVLEGIDGVSLAFLSLLERDNMTSPSTMAEMEELVDFNQALLQSLGVSHPSLQEVCSTCLQFGLHAKLTGAGGGGFAMALVPPNLPDKSLALAKQTLETQGYTCNTAAIGGPGFSIELVDQLQGGGGESVLVKRTIKPS